MAADAFSPARDNRTATITRIGIALLLAATVALVCVVRMRLAGVPLERDEGEYAYAGQLILKGVPPYLAVYNMKFPGMYYAYAAVMAVFGQAPTGIRLGLLSVHLMSLGLLFIWGRRVVGEFAAAIGTAVFALLALDRWSMGVFAHATHFVMFFVLAALVVLQDGRRTWRLIMAGALLGLAIVVKQQALPFALVGVALAMRGGGDDSLFGRDAIRRGVMVAGGIALSLVLLVAAMAAQGVLGQFWHWTIQYAAAYVSETPASMATTIFGMAWSYVTQTTGWWWYLGLVGVVLLLVTRWPGSTRIVLVATLGAAVLAIVPGYFFRPHYFILAMPVIGLLVGVAFASADRVFAGAMGPARARMAALVLFAAIAGVQIVRDRHFLFDMPPTELIRAVYQTNPFLEAPAIGRYLKAHTRPTDRIAVLGSEPEVLFHADRPSATGYIYMYSLTERQPFAAGMQQELIQDITAARPLYVVLVDAAASWVSSLHPDTRVVTWANTFVSTCYDRVGIVDIDPAGPATILWDAAAVGYKPRFTSKVSVFKRQTTGVCASGQP